MGRSYNSLSTFSPNDSKSVCDITGFVVKKSELVRRWEGWFVLPEAWHPRHPQDTPVVPTPQKVHDNVRTQSENTTAADSFDKV